MISINIDNLNAFYLTMAIVGLGFAVLVVFGKTEKRSSRNKKTTTTS